jgi:excisionase family DNA binding protein
VEIVMEPDNGSFVTPVEAARMIRVHVDTIYRIARRGMLPKYRVLGRSLRFKTADVLRLAMLMDIERLPEPARAAARDAWYAKAPGNAPAAASASDSKAGG